MSLTFFENDVLEPSHQTPVLVDFWAEWCGPCRILGPVLERLEAEAQGRWKLVKLNTEEHPDVAEAMRISSIPAVKLFVNGQVQGEFVGALPEPQIRAFLDQHIPNATESQVREAQRLLTEGREEEAAGILADLHLASPESTRIAALLAWAYLHANPERALELAKTVQEGQLGFETAGPVAVLAGLDQHRAPPRDASERIHSAWERFREGAEAFSRRDYDSAARAWLRSVQSSRTLNDDAAKEAAVALFNILGEDHPVTQEYRRQLASMMF